MTTSPTTRNETVLLPRQHLWVGTYHGTHYGDRVVVTTTRDDTQPLPYDLKCTCGFTQRHTYPVTLDRAAERHTHPTLWDRLLRLMQRRTNARRGSGPARRRGATG